MSLMKIESPEIESSSKNSHFCVKENLTVKYELLFYWSYHRNKFLGKIFGNA